MSVAGNKLGGRTLTHVSGKIYSLALVKKMGRYFKTSHVRTTVVYSNQRKIHSSYEAFIWAQFRDQYRCSGKINASTSHTYRMSHSENFFCFTSAFTQLD